MGLRAFLTNRRWLIMLAGTAGTWFLLDYAYYGNTISTPQILGLISPHASTMTKIALQLAIFVVAAVPGYVLAIARLDRIGHRRLQLTGFAMMALCFAIIAIVPGMTTMVVPFLLVYGVSYFFTEFGPNMTTFVMPSELYPVSMRATGHGISAGVGKLGAFIGVFLFPVLQTSLGLRGTLLLTAGVSVLGFALTLVLPEPAGLSLEDMIPTSPDVAVQPLRVAGQRRQADHPHVPASRRSTAGLLTVPRAASSVAVGISAAAMVRNAAAQPKVSPTARPASRARYARYRVISQTRPRGVNGPDAGCGTSLHVHAVIDTSDVPCPGRPGWMNSARSASSPIRFRTKPAWRRCHSSR